MGDAWVRVAVGTLDGERPCSTGDVKRRLRPCVSADDGCRGGFRRSPAPSAAMYCTALYRGGERRVPRHSGGSFAVGNAVKPHRDASSPSSLAGSSPARSIRAKAPTKRQKATTNGRGIAGNARRAARFSVLQAREEERRRRAVTTPPETKSRLRNFKLRMVVDKIHFKY